jgi:hypothetical protein
VEGRDALEPESSNGVSDTFRRQDGVRVVPESVLVHHVGQQPVELLTLGVRTRWATSPALRSE